MKTNQEIFLNWIKDRKFPPAEIDASLADNSDLKFDNHEEDATDKDFINPQQLDSAFNLIQRALK